MDVRIELGNGMVAVVEDPDPDRIVRLLKGLANGQGELAAVPSLLELTPPPAPGPPAHIDWTVTEKPWARIVSFLEGTPPLPVERVEQSAGDRYRFRLTHEEAVDVYAALQKAIKAMKPPSGSMYTARRELEDELDKHFGNER